MKAELQKWHPPYSLRQSFPLSYSALRHIYRQDTSFLVAFLYFQRVRIFRTYFIYINKFLLSLKIFLGVGTFVVK